jgi:hypothetical protein
MVCTNAYALREAQIKLKKDLTTPELRPVTVQPASVVGPADAGLFDDRRALLM